MEARSRLVAVAGHRGRCGTILAFVLLLAAFGLWLEAAQGVHGTGWQIGTILGTIVVVLLLAAGGFVALDQRFGWGYTDVPETPDAHTRDPSDVVIEETLDEQNYGAVTESSQDDLSEKLQRLADLRDRGLITEEDFEAKKRDLLDRM